MDKVGATCTVSIGRGNLPNGAWKAFRKSTLVVVTNYSRQVYFAGTGAGVYEGTPEESYTIVSEFKLNSSFHDYSIFYAAIADLAKEFAQDCIAVTFGDTELVKASA